MGICIDQGLRWSLYSGNGIEFNDYLQSCGENKGKPTWNDKVFWGWQQQTVVTITVPMLERVGKASGDGKRKLQKRATPRSCAFS